MPMASKCSGLCLKTMSLKLRRCPALQCDGLTSVCCACQARDCGPEEATIVERRFLLPQTVAPDQAWWVEIWATRCVLDVAESNLVFPRVPLALAIREQGLKHLTFAPTLRHVINSPVRFLCVRNVSRIQSINLSKRRFPFRSVKPIVNREGELGL